MADKDSFSYWLRTQKFTVTVSLLSACLPLILQAIADIKGTEILPFKTDYINNGFNILFILITLFMLAQSSFLINKETDKSIRLYNYVRDKLGGNSLLYNYGEDILFHRMDLSFRQFYYSWIVIWVIWLIMYIGKLCYKIELSTEVETELKNIYIFRNECLFENTLNIINSFAMFFIYMVITISTVSVSFPGNNRSQMHTAVIFLIFLGTCCVLADYYSLFIGTDSESLQKYYKLQFGIHLFIGIIACMSMMAVLGRLNSSFLDIPQWLIVSLYFYAALQMLYPFALLEEYINRIYPENKEMANLKEYFGAVTQTLYFLAFLGKICLFLVIWWIMQKKRFLFFLIHKAHSLAESDGMLSEFNRYYERYEEKQVDL